MTDAASLIAALADRYIVQRELGSGGMAMPVLSVSRSSASGGRRRYRHSRAN